MPKLSTGSSCLARVAAPAIVRVLPSLICGPGKMRYAVGVDPPERVMEAKLKHLEFIQGIVNRLATDSFRLKGWTVVLISAVVVLLARTERIEFAHFSVAPVVAFWGLDGYFLWQERLFRALYDHVRQLNASDIDFSMDIRPFRTSHARTWLGATFSRTLIGFYGVLTAFTLGVVVVMQ